MGEREQGKERGGNRLVKENLWKRGDQLPAPYCKVSFSAVSFSAIHLVLWRWGRSPQARAYMITSHKLHLII